MLPARFAGSLDVRRACDSGRQVSLRGPDVVDVRADELVVRGLLQDVGGPAGVPCKRERRREEVRREADAHEDRGRIKFDVRLERAIRVLLGQDPEGDVLQVIGGKAGSNSMTRSATYFHSLLATMTVL